MKRVTAILIAANFLVLSAGIMFVIKKSKERPNILPPIAKTEQVLPKIIEPIKPPIDFKISNPKPAYMNYQETVARLREWSSEAPELTEFGTYGKSSKGKDLCYLRIFNKRNNTDKPKVLLTACIHGNEPLASSTLMWWTGSLLDSYKKDEKIKSLIDERDIYIIPVVSPDSYPSSRRVDGVDPNRDFPSPSDPSHKSTPSVAALQNFTLKIKPNAVISGHTWGRVFLTPYGDKMAHTENKEDYDRIVGEMARLSNYRMIRACDMYGISGLNNPPIKSLDLDEEYLERHFSLEGKHGSPIRGTEVDWYYRNGAFAIVCEFGTHQRIPTNNDTKIEFERTWMAVLKFIQDGPIVKIK